MQCVIDRGMFEDLAEKQHPDLESQLYQQR